MKNAGANALDRLFSNAETPQNDVADTSTDISIPGTQKPVKGSKKTVKKVFSFRAVSEDVTTWRLYADARSGMTMDDIGREAMNEYIQNHPLKKKEKTVFNAKMKALKS